MLPRRLAIGAAVETASLAVLLIDLATAHVSSVAASPAV